MSSAEFPDLVAHRPRIRVRGAPFKLEAFLTDTDGVARERTRLAEQFEENGTLKTETATQEGEQ